MDPNEAMTRFLDAICAGLWEEAEEAAEALVGWVRRGGFLPDDPRPRGQRR